MELQKKHTHTPNMENYFILRINYDKPTYYLNILYYISSYN